MPMPQKDKLIRGKCPLCSAKITLVSSALDKKIHCPKCRQAVVISNGENSAAITPQAVAASVSVPAAPPAPRRRESKTQSPLLSLPVAAGPDSGDRFGPEPSENAIPSPGDRGFRTSDRSPVIYCICKGVIKKLKAGPPWNSTGSVCCMCNIEGS